MNGDTALLIQRLSENIAAHGSAVVAFSAGVDSTVVLRVAHDVLGDRALAVTGMSPSVAPAEAADAERIAAEIGTRLVFEPTAEMRRPDYVANGNDRCFHCKTELYEVCADVAQQHGMAVVLNGTNVDDRGDWRPGLAAADDAGVRSPLLDCGLGKAEVRAVAHALGLSNWDKPALACLASRLPYGTAVTIERLAAVDTVERALRTMGFRQVRARDHGEQTSLEVEPERVDELRARLHEPDLAAALAEAGYRRAVVADDGYRTGRLNDAALGGPAR